jgi:hypothetical protein
VPRCALINAAGHLEMLSTGWREHPAALVFLRYFGCPIYGQQVIRLRAVYERYGLTTGSLIQVFGPQCVAPMVRAALQPGCRQWLPHGGNLLRMPGAFVVDTDGVVLLAPERDDRRHADDRPLIDALGGARRAA